jgi:hypothetical protein
MNPSDAVFRVFIDDTAAQTRAGLVGRDTEAVRKFSLNQVTAHDRDPQLAGKFTRGNPAARGAEANRQNYPICTEHLPKFEATFATGALEWPLETLVVALTRSLASWQPSLARSLRATADELRERYRHLPMRDSSPETADLVAAEFQEAWDRLM